MDEDDIISVGVAAAVKAQQAIRVVCLAFDEHEEKLSRKRTRRHFRRTDYDNSTWGRMLRDSQCNDPTHPDGAQFRRRLALDKMTLTCFNISLIYSLIYSLKVCNSI
jgi:hypothetical protein